METGRLVVMDVLGPAIRRTWYAACHADKALLPAMTAFRTFALAEGAAHLPRVPGVG